MVVIVLSQVLYWFDVKATYEVVKPPAVPTEETYYGGSSEPVDVGPTEPVPSEGYRLVTETATVKGLLTGEGVRYLFTSFVSNFRNFSAMAIMLVVMIGVGLAEAAGLIASLIRKLVGVSSRGTLTLIIVLLGVLSSVASDAGYLVLIPLGAAAFKSVGRNPLAGIAAAFAGVAAGFGVNVLITPLDGVLTEITNDSIPRGERRRAHRPRREPVLRHRLDDLRHAAPDVPHDADRREAPRGSGTRPTTARAGRWTTRTRPTVSPEADSRGLRWAGLGALGGARSRSCS